MSWLDQISGDAQTAITSLGSAIAGSVSETGGTYLIRSVGISAGNSLGDVGTRFIVRALVSSLVFGATATLMPESSGNIFFSIVYFAANKSLVSDAVAVGSILVNGATLRGLQPGLSGPRKHGGGAPAESGDSCACKL